MTLSHVNVFLFVCIFVLVSDGEVKYNLSLANINLSVFVYNL